MDGIVKLEFCGSKDQLADIMTKHLTLEVFTRLRGTTWSLHSTNFKLTKLQVSLRESLMC
jgi:hypothetical protein